MIRSAALGTALSLTVSVCLSVLDVTWPSERERRAKGEKQLKLRLRWIHAHVRAAAVASLGHSTVSIAHTRAHSGTGDGRRRCAHS